jgi:hypothetical protein
MVPLIKYCASDASFWAVKQQVAIPGWLRLNQKDVLL